MAPDPEQVKRLKKYPWLGWPRWVKWTIGIVGALVLLGIGGALGSSNEGDLEDEVSALESKLADTHAEAVEAEQRASRIEGLRGKIVGEAKDRASTMLSGAKRESEVAKEDLGSLQDEVESTEDQLAEVEGSLAGAEHTKALSHFGEGIVKSEVDFVPGTYESAGGEGCYWALLNSANTNDMAGNEFTSSAAQQIVTITTPYFQSTNCGTWERIGE
jgi:hypothetical protein